MKYTLPHILAILLLAGCNQIPSQQNKSDAPMGWHPYKNTMYNYEIDIPDSAFIPDKSKTKDQIFFGNIHQGENKNNEFDIDIYAQKVDSCSATSIGISSPSYDGESITEDRMWGEVDQKDDGSYPDPNCRVNSVYPEKNPREYMTAYAFCAEKNGKTVLICISQITDNPQLAEEIFKTFRWTE